MIRVAIYKRVSTIEQASEGYSLAAQEKVLMDYCESKGYIVVKIYADEGISGKDIKHRPQMQQLLIDAAERQFDIVLVWKLTRLTRSLSDLCNICDLLEKNSVAFISYSESFDCSTPAGRMMRNILGVVAQWEREVISENVKLAMVERASQGKRTCSYVLGYDKDGTDSLKINENEAKIIKFVYDSYIREKRISAVSRICNERGFCGKRGAKFKEESIHKILTRFVYCGYYSFCGVPYKGNHPSIISIRQYNAVQKTLSLNSAGRKRKNRLVLLPDSRTKEIAFL